MLERREWNGMGKIKILLVDDEREEREGISWLIEKYEISTGNYAGFQWKGSTSMHRKNKG